ncbi:hypothetical protein CLOM_g8084 [Closterium sp. NIES-68]|nr:hypothetical protein CLOM_g8084 [Closterium sp. NIES-68]
MEAVVMEDMAATTMATGRAEVKGMGKAMFKGADGKMVGLKNVLLVPNLAANLISATWAVHLGMAQNSKGWLLWDPFTKKFLVSRDCKFMENLPYKEWKAENQAKIGAISSKWLFKRKTDADGNIERYKSRLVAKGYQQQEKKDYNEVYAPVVKGTTLRTLFAAAAIKGWVVKQMDICGEAVDASASKEVLGGLGCKLWEE